VVEPVRQAIAGGAVKGMSFRFTPVRDSWEDAKGKPVDPDELESLLYGHRSADDDRLPLKRTLHEVKLHEAGPVVNPAYANTAVGVRSLDDMEPDELEAARKALIQEYRSTMTRSADPEPEPVEDKDRSGATDGDNDEDDTLEFDHFASDVPVREDGLPEADDGDYEADEAEGRAAKDPKKPYGAVKYADPGYQDDGKARYPVDTKEHADAAWKYINKAKNAGKYAADKLAKVKATIKSAAKKFGIKVDDDDESKSTETTGAARSQGTPDERHASLLDAGFTAEEADEMLGIQRNADAAPNEGTSENNDNPEGEVATAMKTKEEYEARQVEIAERFKALLGETRDSALTEEQDKEWEELVAERKANVTALEKIEERRAFVESLAVGGSVERGDGSRTPSSPAFHAERDVYDVESIERSAYSAGSKDRAERVWVDAAERAIEKAKFAPAPDNYSGKDSADVAAKLLDTVADGPTDLARRMVLTGSPEYERAFQKFLKDRNDSFMTNEERRTWIRAQELSVNASGGFAMPFQLDPTIILTNSGTVNPIRQLAKVIQITGKEYDFVTSAGATAVRGAELSVASDGTLTLAQPTVRTNRVSVFIPFSFEADAAWNNIRAELTSTMVDAKEREEDSFWVGNGTGVQPQGIKGYAATAGIPNYTTSATGEFSAVDVHGTYDLLPPRFEDKSVWAAHKSVYGLIRQFDTAGGAELWARIGDGQPPTLLDQKAVRVSALPATSAGVVPAATTGIMVLGDFSQFVIVDRIGMNVELIPNVMDPTTGFPTGQRGLYALWMNNSVIRVPQAFVTLNSHA
jgi:HK97 family phage major capsid protein